MSSVTRSVLLPPFSQIVASVSRPEPGLTDGLLVCVSHLPVVTDKAQVADILVTGDGGTTLKLTSSDEIPLHNIKSCFEN